MSKVDKYVALIPRIQSVLSGETDEIARMSNMAALLHFEFGFWWTGFYRVVSADELVLGPFQGPVACTRIKKGRESAALHGERTAHLSSLMLSSFPDTSRVQAKAGAR